MLKERDIKLINNLVDKGLFHILGANFFSKAIGLQAVLLLLGCYQENSLEYIVMHRISCLLFCFSVE